VVFVCRPCSRCFGPVDRCIGYPTEVGCVVPGAGRRGSVASGVAQRAQPGAFRFVFMFLYFRCSFDVFVAVSCLCACVLPCMA